MIYILVELITVFVEIVIEVSARMAPAHMVAKRACWLGRNLIPRLGKLYTFDLGPFIP
jgi:hypothetical protein